MLEFVPIVALLGLVYSLIQFLKAATSKKVNHVVTQLVTWFAGFIVSWLFSESDFGGSIAVGDTGETLASLNFASLVLVGVTVGSLATVLYDAKRAVDSSDSAVSPKLLD